MSSSRCAGGLSGLSLREARGAGPRRCSTRSASLYAADRPGAPLIEGHAPAHRPRRGAGRRSRAPDPRRADEWSRPGRAQRGPRSHPEGKRQRRTIFFSTHILSDVEMLCDHVTILRQGEVVVTGAMAELLRATCSARRRRCSARPRNSSGGAASRGTACAAPETGTASRWSAPTSSTPSSGSRRGRPVARRGGRADGDARGSLPAGGDYRAPDVSASPSRSGCALRGSPRSARSPAALRAPLDRRRRAAKDIERALARAGAAAVDRAQSLFQNAEPRLRARLCALVGRVAQSTNDAALTDWLAQRLSDADAGPVAGRRAPSARSAGPPRRPARRRPRARRRAPRAARSRRGHRQRRWRAGARRARGSRRRRRRARTRRARGDDEARASERAA